MSRYNNAMLALTHASHRTAYPRLVRFAAAAALLAVVVFANLPSTTLLWQALQDFAHAPAFFVISLILIGPYRQLRPATLAEYLRIFTLCVLLGIAVEALQATMHRDASAKDVLTDLLGTISGLAAHAWWTRKDASRRVWRLGTALLAMLAMTSAVMPVAWLVAAYATRDYRFPVLASFHTPLDLTFISGIEHDTAIRQLPSWIGRHKSETALLVSLSSAEYSGVTIDEPVADWSSYRAFVVDLANAGDRPLSLHLRVHDRAHDQTLDDRFNRTLTLAPRSRRIWRFPLEDIRASPLSRRMNVARIEGIVIFARGPHAGESFFLNGIWLE